MITFDIPVKKTDTVVVLVIRPQGSGGAALGRALGLSLEIKQHFARSLDEICYGKIRSHPQAWQDDILRI